MAFGVVLLLNRQISEALAVYSASVGRANSPYMVLGDSAPPHITLLHAECESDVAELWWERCASALDHRIAAVRAGLIFEAIPKGDPYVPNGGVGVGVEILRSSVLDSAHRTVLAAADSLSMRPKGAVGEFFRPHITLSVLEAFPAGAIPFRPDLVAGEVVGELALGELGPYGTFPQILHVAE